MSQKKLSWLKLDGCRTCKHKPALHLTKLRNPKQWRMKRLNKYKICKVAKHEVCNVKYKNPIEEL